MEENVPGCSQEVSAMRWPGMNGAVGQPARGLSGAVLGQMCSGPKCCSGAEQMGHERKAGKGI